MALERRIEAELGSAATPSSSPSSRRSSPSTRCASGCTALLMLALYRCGARPRRSRRTAAARAALVDELGIEPSPALQELERAILRQDPSLDARRRHAPVAARRGRSLVAAARPDTPSPRSSPSPSRLLASHRVSCVVVTRSPRRRARAAPRRAVDDAPRAR